MSATQSPIARFGVASFAVLGAAVVALVGYDYACGRLSAVVMPGATAPAGLPTVTRIANAPVPAAQPAFNAGSPAIAAHVPLRAASPATVQASSIDARVVTAGTWMPTAWTGAPALESGSRFQLVINPSRPGRVAVYATNPLGERSAAPVWSGWVPADDNYRTPNLRLVGNRGMETLHVVLSPARDRQGRLIAAGSTKTVQVWHY